MIKRLLFVAALVSMYTAPTLCSDQEAQKPNQSQWHKLKADAPLAFHIASWVGWFYYSAEPFKNSYKGSWEAIKSSFRLDMPGVSNGLVKMSHGALKLALVNIGSRALLVGGGILNRIGSAATSL